MLAFLMFCFLDVLLFRCESSITKFDPDVQHRSAMTNHQKLVLLAIALSSGGSK